MDQQRFDAALKALHTGTTRRRGLAAALGVLLGGAGLDAAAKRQGQGQGQSAASKRPAAAGPCGDGSAKDNKCAKDGDCCTKYCADGACRCKPNYMDCSKDAHCCAGRCAGGKCDGGAKPAASACQENFNCQDGLACINGVCTVSNKAKCTQSNCPGCCSGTTCRLGSERNACGSGGGVCAGCSANQTCQAGICRAAGGSCTSNAQCSGATDTCASGTCRCGSGPACSGATPICDGGACRAPAWYNQTTFGSQGTGADEFSSPNGVFVSPDGLTAWVADGNNNRISVWTRPGTTGANATNWTNQTTFGADGSDPNQFSYPGDVFGSPDGLTVWIGDDSNNRVSVWTRPGTTGANATAWANQTTFGVYGTGPNQFKAPSGVFVSADGLTVWIADYSNHRISVWTRPGTTGANATAWTNQTTFGSNGSSPSQFDTPYGVYASVDGLTAWVADSGNARISVWTRPGTTGANATAWTNQSTFGSNGTTPSQFDTP
ncbi:MAG: hypothetical protein ACR2J8_06165 [Thermomicrobiales bacterium]